MLDSDCPNFETHTDCGAAMVAISEQHFGMKCRCGWDVVACWHKCALVAWDYHGNSCSKTWASSSSDTPSTPPCPIATVGEICLAAQYSSASWRPCPGLELPAESLPSASIFAHASFYYLPRCPTPVRTAYYTRATFLAFRIEPPPRPDNTCCFLC